MAGLARHLKPAARFSAAFVALFTFLTGSVMAGGYLTAPSGYRAGDTAAVSGIGFQAGATVNLKITDPAGGIVVRSAVSNDSGAFELPVYLSQPGRYQAAVYDNAGATLFSVAIEAAPRQ